MADKYLGEVSTEGLTSAEKFKREIELVKSTLLITLGHGLFVRMNFFMPNIEH